MAGFNRLFKTGKNILTVKVQPIEKADARHKRDLFPHVWPWTLGPIGRPERSRRVSAVLRDMGISTVRVEGSC